MSRSRLFLAVAVLILIALGATFWLGGDRGGAPPETQSAQTAGETSGALTGVLTAANDLNGAETAGSSLRTALREGSELDPDIRNALSGFRGRILDYRESPVDGCGVRIYRFAMDSVIRPDMSPMGLAMEPDYVAGETRTDPDGRFLITGVWPRGMFLLLGGIDTQRDAAARNPRSASRPDRMD